MFYTAIITEKEPTERQIYFKMEKYSWHTKIKKFIKFEDETGQVLENYKTKNIAKIKLQSGEIVDFNSEKLYRKIGKKKFEEYKRLNNYGANIKLKSVRKDNNVEYFVRDPDGLGAKVVGVPIKEIFSKFEDYAKYIIKNNGNKYGDFVNPNGEYFYWDKEYFKINDKEYLSVKVKDIKKTNFFDETANAVIYKNGDFKYEPLYLKNILFEDNIKEDDYITICLCYD